jgi:hypothetical protein
MSTRAAAWLAYSMLAVGLLFGVLGCLLFFLNGRPPSGDTWYTLTFSAFPIVGVVIASHRPQNPIGWLFCIIGLANGLYFFSDEYAFYTLVHRPGVLPGWRVAGLVAALDSLHHVVFDVLLPPALPDRTTPIAPMASRSVGLGGGVHPRDCAIRHQARPHGGHYAHRR